MIRWTRRGAVLMSVAVVLTLAGGAEPVLLLAC
jgi:hypothetical protein